MSNLALLISSLFIFSTILLQFKIHRNASAENLKNRQRLISWWIIFAVCLLCFYIGLIGITVLSIGLLVWASVELSQILNIKNKAQFLLLASLIAVVVIASIFLWPVFSQFFFFVCLLMALLSYLIPINSLMIVPVFLLYSVLGLSSIILIAILTNRAGYDFAYLLLVLFFITAVNDIAQYITGSLLGKMAIAPRLSPNKTFEGVLGGILVTALLSGVLLPKVLNILWTEAAAIGGLLALAGFLGDLILSKLKRGVNIKDSGTSIKGHGGLFDRIDSLLLIAPVFGVLLFIGD